MVEHLHSKSSGLEASAAPKVMFCLRLVLVPRQEPHLQSIKPIVLESLTSKAAHSLDVLPTIEVEAPNFQCFSCCKIHSSVCGELGHVFEDVSQLLLQLRRCGLCYDDELEKRTHAADRLTFEQIGPNSSWMQGVAVDLLTKPVSVEFRLQRSRDSHDGGFARVVAEACRHIDSR